MLKRAYDYLATYGLLVILAALLLVWTVLALLLLSPLPRNWRRAGARYTMMRSLRFFSWTLTLSGAYQLDLSALDPLRSGPPLILAPNHPTSIDALFLLARHPDLACILKPELMSSASLGVAARLASFMHSDPPRRMIRSAVAELRRGGSVLLFPEGTRTTRVPLNPLTGSAAVIARHARAPIQIAIIETDSPYLGKGWSIFKVPPHLPIRFRVRLGRRLEPSEDVAGCTATLGRELARELASAPQNGWLAAREGGSGGKALLDGP
ncbi:MAG: lysophospholipid acyltransferase family protein [Steroidobacteraceae bacterium]